jgi:hypothetical protein
MQHLERVEDIKLMSDAAINSMEYGNSELAKMFFIFAGRMALAEDLKMELVDA